MPRAKKVKVQPTEATPIVPANSTDVPPQALQPASIAATPQPTEAQPTRIAEAPQLIPGTKCPHCRQKIRAKVVTPPTEKQLLARQNFAARARNASAAYRANRAALPPNSPQTGDAPPLQATQGAERVKVSFHDAMRNVGAAV
jgi:hypothetical protein